MPANRNILALARELESVLNDGVSIREVGVDCIWNYPEHIVIKQ